MTNRAEIILAAKDATAQAFASVGQKLDGLANKIPGVTGGLSGIGRAAGAGLVVAGTAGIAAYAAFDRLVGKVSELQDISEKTGASAAAFGGIAVAAEVGGVAMEDLVAKSIKLTKNLTEVTDESKATGAALKALNIPIEDFKKADPVTRYELLAKALAKFKDGAGKTAVLEDLVKGGAQLLPFLKELEQQGGRQVKLTDQQIAQADEYKDRQTRSRAELGVYAQVLAINVLPAVVAVTDGLRDFAKGFVSVEESANGVAKNNAFREYALSIVESIADIIEAIDKVPSGFKFFGTAVGGRFAAIDADLRGDVEGAKQIRRELEADLESIAKGGAGTRLADSLRTNVARQRASLFDGATPDNRPSLDGYKGKTDLAAAAASAAALAKKQLEGDLKDIARQLQAQRDLYQFNGQQLQLIYEQGNTSLSDYFGERRALREQFNADEDRLAQREIERIQKSLSGLPKSAKPEERADLENKLAEAVDKRARTQAKAGQDAILVNLQEQKSAEDLRRSYKSFTAELLALRGDQRGADLVRIAQQVEEARKLSNQAGGDPARVEEYNRLLQGQAAFNALQTDAGRITEAAANAEERYTLAAQQGYVSENAQLREQGRIRQAALAQIAGLVEQAGQLKDALQTPEAIQNYDRLLTQFTRMAATADPLTQKMREFNDQVGNIGSDAFRDLISGGKSFAEVLGNIGQRLANLVLEESFLKPLSKAISGGLNGQGPAGDLLGGVGGFFKSVLGVGGSGAAAGASTGSLGLDSIFGGFFANGGEPPIGKVSIVGERGAELFVPRTAGTVLPHGVLQSLGGAQAITVTNNFTLSGPTDRRSQAQVAAAAGMGVQTAIRRNT